MKRTVFLATCFAVLVACGTTYNKVSDRYEYRPACSMDPGASQDPACVREAPGGYDTSDKKLNVFQTPTPAR